MTSVLSEATGGGRGGGMSGRGRMIRSRGKIGVSEACGIDNGVE